jgi:hypothetical protein
MEFEVADSLIITAAVHSYFARIVLDLVAYVSERLALGAPGVYRI